MNGQDIKTAILMQLIEADVDFSLSFEADYVHTFDLDEMDSLDIIISDVLEQGCPLNEDDTLNMVHSLFYGEYNETIAQFCELP